MSILKTNILAGRFLSLDWLGWVKWFRPEAHLYELWIVKKPHKIPVYP